MEKLAVYHLVHPPLHELLALSRQASRLLSLSEAHTADVFRRRVLMMIIMLQGDSHNLTCSSLLRISIPPHPPPPPLPLPLSLCQLFPSAGLAFGLSKRFPGGCKQLRYHVLLCRYFRYIKQEMEAHLCWGVGCCDFPMTPPRIVALTRQILPEDCLVCLDNGLYKVCSRSLKPYYPCSFIVLM